MSLKEVDSGKFGTKIVFEKVEPENSSIQEVFEQVDSRISAASNKENLQNLQPSEEISKHFEVICTKHFEE